MWVRFREFATLNLNNLTTSKCIVLKISGKEENNIFELYIKFYEYCRRIELVFKAITVKSIDLKMI